MIDDDEKNVAACVAATHTFLALTESLANARNRDKRLLKDEPSIEPEHPVTKTPEDAVPAGVSLVAPRVRAPVDFEAQLTLPEKTQRRRVEYRWHPLFGQELIDAVSSPARARRSSAVMLLKTTAAIVFAFLRGRSIERGARRCNLPHNP